MRGVFLEKNNTGTVDNRMISIMRLVLGFSALFIIFLDPFEPSRLVGITYAVLIFYVLYSIGIYYSISRNNQFTEYLSDWSHWIDICWYLVLIALSKGTSSIFFFFFFFSILISSFKKGFSEGLKVTLTSSLLFTVVGYMTSPSGTQFELDRFLLRPVYLVVLGYMMAYWGGYEIILKKRLELLREISILSNPRFGVDRTLNIVLSKLREFYQAAGCLLIINDMTSGEAVLRHIGRDDTEVKSETRQPSQQMIRSFLTLPPEAAVILKPQQSNFFGSDAKFYAVDLATGEETPELQNLTEDLAAALDADCFVSVPVYLRKEVLGRLYITSEKGKQFGVSDVAFLLQALDQFMPVIENIQLVDQLASSAAEEERKRIARDIHDSIVQPYIGLQLGLDSLSQALDSDSAEGENGFSEFQSLLKRRIERLRELTQKGTADLRRYIRGLSETGKTESSLYYSLHSYAQKFSEAAGIKVNIKIDDKIIVADRLTAEMFQLIVEGLSNIRRHTQSPFANVKLGYSGDTLIVNIENEREAQTDVENFIPRSITGRVKSLGGTVDVRQPDGFTQVYIEIPM